MYRNQFSLGNIVDVPSMFMVNEINIIFKRGTVCIFAFYSYKSTYISELFRRRGF